MKKHEEKARELFHGGMNCAQAVFCAFSDVTGFDEKTALAISSSFGGGMGRLREVCGAVSGMLMVAGVKYGAYDVNDNEAKASHYALIQSLAKQFAEENGSYICRELLELPSGADEPTPEKRTESYYKRRPCAEYVACAARILDKQLGIEQ
ncbi:MAG: C_GCAxxG_C_C family protein [Ruminococcaceae bacterium]|nr:C_GCAxxG_C_C family protein [Oscillospiraceae bacterium]